MIFRRNRKRLFQCSTIFLLVALVGCRNASPSAPALDGQLQAVITTHELFPLEPVYPQDPALVRLGQALFFDKVLSGSRDVSCATCHHPLAGSGDGLALPIGVGGRGLGPTRQISRTAEFVPRNAPDLFNRGYAGWTTMFWDGRVSGTMETGFISPADDQLPDGLTSVLAVQAMFPVTSRIEMRGMPDSPDGKGGTNELAALNDDDFAGVWEALMVRLLKLDPYRTYFAEAYPGTRLNDLSFAHAANALAAYQTDAFNTVDSPWNRYLAGDADALSTEAKRGALLFYGEAGCVACHQGALFTDQQYHNLAVPQFGPGKDDHAPFDWGRANETNSDVDKYAFRTPSLWNVALTGPWMHNGAYDALDDVIRHHLSPAEWLRSYEGDHLHPRLVFSIQRDEALYAEMLVGLDPLVEDAADLRDADVDALVAFLHALTAADALNLRDTVPNAVPSGLPLGD